MATGTTVKDQLERVWHYIKNLQQWQIVLLMAFCIVLISLWKVDIPFYTPGDSGLPPTVDYDGQLKELNRVEHSLAELQDFVRVQKQIMIDTQQTTARLRDDAQQLKPLLEYDRATVEAVLRAYNHEQSRRIWRERGIGFLGGILSSLIASTLYGTALRRRRNNVAKSAKRTVGV